MIAGAGKRFFVGLSFAAIAMTAAAEPLVRTGETIAFLGDSITYYGNSRPLGYIHLVTNGLEAVGVKVSVIPAGIGGHKSDDLLARLAADVLSRKPQWMTLSCGVNDVFHAHLPGRKGVPLADYRRNVTEILDRCAAAGVKVILMTPTMITEDAANVQNVELEAYCAWLRQIAAERRLPLADLNAAMRAEVSRRRTVEQDEGNKLTWDGIHMLADGDEMIAAGILGAMGIDVTTDVRIRRAWTDYRQKVIAEESRFVPLLDGHDLKGWNGATNRFCVTSDGLLTYIQSGESGGDVVKDLRTVKDYFDFVIRYEVKIPTDSDNGLGIRMRTNGAEEGMTIHLKDRHLRPEGEWNAVEITAVGTKLSVVLNGAKIIDTDTLRNRIGRIRLFGQGSWRNIRILEL